MGEPENFAALRDFRSHWDRAGVASWFHTTITVVFCRVLYTVRKRTLDTEATVQFRHQSGNIEIHEEGGLNVEHYYLGPSPRYQDMSFDPSTGDLTVTGTGPKTGDYTIIFTPLYETTI